MFKFIIDFLTFLGLYYKQPKIVFVGLENAGKTTLMYVLRDDNVLKNPSIQSPAPEEVMVGKIKIWTIDIGGCSESRYVWKKYYQKVDAVVFLVDTVDKKRFPEVKKELNFLLNDFQLKDTPFLILANKIDQPGATREEDLKAELGLEYLKSENLNSNNPPCRPFALFMCSVIRKIGYGDGFRWLARFL